jgi:hypothetical protein
MVVPGMIPKDDNPAAIHAFSMRVAEADSDYIIHEAQLEGTQFIPAVLYAH